MLIKDYALIRDPRVNSKYLIYRKNQSDGFENRIGPNMKSHWRTLKMQWYNHKNMYRFSKTTKHTTSSLISSTRWQILGNVCLSSIVWGTLTEKHRVERSALEKRKKMFASSANRDQKRHFQGPNFAPIVWRRWLLTRHKLPQYRRNHENPPKGAVNIY